MRIFVMGWIGCACTLGLATNSGAATTVWETFSNSTTVGMTSGLDLLVGTADDVPPPAGTTGFNSTGSLAHLFFLDLGGPALGDETVTAGASFSLELNDPTSLAPGTGGTVTNFSLTGRGDDNVFVSGLQLGFPYSIRDNAGTQPHEMIVAAGGRSFTLAVTQESCLDTDAGCLDPLSVIDTFADGIVLRPGDDPATVFQNSSAAFQSFFAIWAGGTADVPGYLGFLMNEAPVGWAGISITTIQLPMDATPGTGNISGIQAGLVDGTWLLGVTPSFTLPEPGSAGAGAVVLLALGALRMRRQHA